MNPRTKKPILLLMAVLGLVALAYFILLGQPSFWTRDFPIDAATNAHLAVTEGLSAEQVALEVIHWNVPVGDRIPREQVSIFVAESTSDAFVVQVTYSPHDDSYGRMFYEITLARAASTWSVTRLKRCWTGRGLTGWSTDTPS